MDFELKLPCILENEPYTRVDNFQCATCLYTDPKPPLGAPVCASAMYHGDGEHPTVCSKTCMEHKDFGFKACNCLVCRTAPNVPQRVCGSADCYDAKYRHSRACLPACSVCHDVPASIDCIFPCYWHKKVHPNVVSWVCKKCNKDKDGVVSVVFNQAMNSCQIQVACSECYVKRPEALLATIDAAAYLHVVRSQY